MDNGVQRDLEESTDAYRISVSSSDIGSRRSLLEPTTIVVIQVDFHRRVEIDSWILMSHIWHDMTLFSV